MKILLQKKKLIKKIDTDFIKDLRVELNYINIYLTHTVGIWY
jgi:hypothetical protein